MKKLLTALLVLLCLTVPALAEIVLVDAYGAWPREAAICEELAGRLTDALGEPVTVRHETDAAQAVNAFLSLDAGSAVLVANQDAMILSLQGYTDQDLRKALVPAAAVARSESRFYVSPAVLAAVPDADAAALRAYSEEEPYTLFIGRLMDASHADYLTLEATQDMYLDQDLYLDYEEAGEAALGGAPDILVFSTAMLPEVAADYVPLDTTGLPGLWQGVFVHKGGGETLGGRLKEVLPSICADPAWLELIGEAGYTARPDTGSVDFATEVKTLFADYVGYLTNEGLFFYED